MPRFDVHAHAITGGTDPAAQQALSATIAREGFAAGQAPGGDWSVEGVIAFMDERKIALQLLSMPVALDPQRARGWNTQTAAIVEAHPNRFGMLAALPMTDPERAVDEVGFALDELQADGFAVTTNYDGVYLGNPLLDPVFAELDRRGAAVFVHPALAPGFEHVGLGRPGPLLEYPVDTARTIVDAVFAGVLIKYPNLSLVLAHGGGVLPTLQDRIVLLGVEPWVANPLHLTADQIRHQLASLYLDTAIAGGPASIAPAIQMVGVEHILFGTDYPPAGIPTIDQTLADLTATVSEETQKDFDIVFGRLFPRAAARAAPPSPVPAPIAS